MGAEAPTPSLSFPDERVAALAARQNGVVTREQAIRCGVSADAIKHRLKRGRLHRLHRSVFLVGHAIPPPLAAETAAVLACVPRPSCRTRAPRGCGRSAQERTRSSSRPPPRPNDRASSRLRELLSLMDRAPGGRGPERWKASSSTSSGPTTASSSRSTAPSTPPRSRSSVTATHGSRGRVPHHGVHVARCHPRASPPRRPPRCRPGEVSHHRARPQERCAVHSSPSGPSPSLIAARPPRKSRANLPGARAARPRPGRPPR